MVEKIVKPERLLSLFLLLLCVGISYQCEDVRQGSFRAVKDAIHNFSVKFYQIIINQTDNNQNIAVSPLSVFTLLMMISIGARGSTLDSIEQTLNFTISDSSWHGMMTKLQANYEKECKNGGVTREVFNAALVSELISVQEEYSNLIAKIFQGDIKQVDFTHPEIVKREFNARVSNVTRGLIQEAIKGDVISRGTKLFLANTLYFKGSWKSPFDEFDSDLPFFTDDMNSISLPFMRVESNFEVAELNELNAKTIFLPYKDMRHGLLIVLPNKLSGLQEMENRMFELAYTPDKMLQSVKRMKVDLSLPKFKINFQTTLTNTLRQLGFQELFSRQSDLSGISAELSSAVEKNFAVVHQSVIEVNEEGSEAAAVSAGVTFLISNRRPFNFVANHPFFYYLIDLENDGIPLFVGRVVNPRSS